jgi:hypothetical protein
MPIRHAYCAVSALLALMLSPSAMAAGETQSTLQDQKSVAVTIYNQDLALVKDVREIDLVRGEQDVALREVSARMRPETALLRSLDDGNRFSVLEQNFDFDLLTPEKLLEKYVGRRVGIVRTHPQTGAESTVQADVLAATQGVVLRVGDKIETGAPGRIVFDAVPGNLRDKPTLVTRLDVQRAGRDSVELSYLTGGLSWQADYVAELNADDSRLSLKGWVTLQNRSGTAYPHATLQLVAGDVNRVRQEIDMAGAVLAKSERPRIAEAPMQEQPLFEYHLYTLARPTSIADNQTKQVSLLSGTDIPVVKEFVLQGNDDYYRSSYADIGQKMKIGVYAEFNNRSADGLGMPLPKGVVRVYKRDLHGRAQFVGEDRIDHTPKDDRVRLKLGDAFDVTADKKQTDFKVRKNSAKYHYAYESAYEIVLKNAKPEAITVTVREPVPGDWRILDESHPHLKEAAGTARWSLALPASGQATLRYRILVLY